MSARNYSSTMAITLSYDFRLPVNIPSPSLVTYMDHKMRTTKIGWEMLVSRNVGNDPGK